MEVETKFLRLFKPVALGERIDGWRVCWIGGWDKCRVVFVVMVDRPDWHSCHHATALRVGLFFVPSLVVPAVEDRLGAVTRTWRARR